MTSAAYTTLDGSYIMHHGMTNRLIDQPCKCDECEAPMFMESCPRLYKNDRNPWGRICTTCEICRLQECDACYEILQPIYERDRTKL